ncbi:MAG: efflux RND transporter permease subunit [Akkermansia sp.]|nr:efflux RND transporter permease subunit [Akkermansia sp.]
MARFFIYHPIPAICISIILILLGAFSLWRLPVSQYPDIIPPTIQISATYPGADCQTVVNSIASPIEQQLSGVDGLSYMTSICTNNGQMNLSVLFEVGTDPNIDQILTYLRYGQAASQLPQEVSALGVNLRKNSGLPAMVVSLYSPNQEYNSLWLANYAYINLIDALKRIPGVGDVQVFGAGHYAMRIWLNPEKMAALNITAQEVKQAIQSQNNVNPAGKTGAPPTLTTQTQSYTIHAPGRLNSTEQFENIIVRGKDNSIVRLSDIARIELGADSYTLSSSVNGQAAASIGIYEAPDGNAIDLVNQVRQMLEETKFPPNLNWLVSMDSTLAVRSGISEIIETLVIAMVLVILVVFLFLQGWRGTLIPAFALPVSIVSIFIAFPFLGFSINTICLMGIVLAIGLVVDDAIIVVEAVKNHLESKSPIIPATLAAMKEVSGPIISTALVISCVFLPTLLLPGITGKLFAQFAITIGCSILISAFCALSLSPALSSRLLDKDKLMNLAFFRLFNRYFDIVKNQYVRLCKFFITNAWAAFLFLILITLSLLPMVKFIPAGFLPTEDQGYIFAGVELPPNTSFNITETESARLEKIIAQTPGVQTVTTVNGFNLVNSVQSSSNAFFFISLTPWNQRKDSSLHASNIVSKLKQTLNQAPCLGLAYAIEPPSLPGIGTTGDVTLMLEDRKGAHADFLAENTATFTNALLKRPEIDSIQNFMSPSTPQFKLKVNTEQAVLQEIDINSIYTTLQAFMGSTFVNYFNIFGREWQVYMQADARYRTNIDQLELFYVKNNEGDPVALNSLITATRTWEPEFLIRQNMFNANQLNITPAPGYSTSQVIAAIDESFSASMPVGMGYNFTGMSYQEKQAESGINITTIFLVSTIFIYFILASLYESWSLPIPIFLTIPIAIFGAFAALLLFGQELNIYSKIGLIMLMALAAKNAILIVEYAVLNLKAGKNLLEATLHAAEVRLRPILMTSITFVMGCIPLALASGSGAAARQVVGICIIGGMLTSIIIASILIPSFFYIIARIFHLPDKLSSTH